MGFVMSGIAPHFNLLEIFAVFATQFFNKLMSEVQVEAELSQLDSNRPPPSPGFSAESEASPSASPSKSASSKSVKSGSGRSQTFPSKFKLTPQLEDGSISLADDERILSRWSYESTSLSLAEYVASVLSFGLYYFITRILLQRMRKYSVIVTNINVIVKEEMMETSWGCLKILLENQASFPISTLTYVCSEVMGQKLCGWLPQAVVLEMRFGRYPVDSEIPVTKYRSLLAILFEPFALATKAAYKNVFGINFDASPINLSVQLMQAIPLMANPHMWLLFGGAFALDLLKQAAQGIYLMMIAALLDPSVGPRQAIGTKDASVFRLDATVSEDPECVTNMRAVLNTLTGLLPDRNIIDPKQKPRLLEPLQVIAPGGKPRHINGARHAKYGVEKNFVVLEDYLVIPQNEVVYDACPVNPYWTFSDVKKVIFSVGAYYITDLAGHMQHRKNLFFTNRRIIQHSVLVSSVGGAVDHSRLDFWVNDDFVNMSATDFKKVTSFHAMSRNFGHMSFAVNRNGAYTMYVFRNLFKPEYVAPKGVRGLTHMSREQWAISHTHTGSTFTATALASNQSESIDVATQADQQLYTDFENMCCCPKPPKVTITSTDEVLYIESHRPGTCFRTPITVFVALPWNEVDGVYWQNFDASGPTCCQSFLLSCCCSCVFGCEGCLCRRYGAKENKPNYYDYFFGYKGSIVSVCSRKHNTFRLGLRVPHQYYGVHHNNVVTALVDSINFRSLLNDPMNAHVDSESLKYRGQMVTVTGSGAGGAMMQLQRAAAGTAMAAQGSFKSGGNSPNYYTSNPVRGQKTMDRGVAVAVAVPLDGSGQPPPPETIISPHPSEYLGFNTRHKPAVHNFPISIEMNDNFMSLADGETFIKGFKVETTHLEDWEIILMFCTFGLGMLWRQIFYQHRRFYNIYITTDRVLIKEEIFELRLWTVSRIVENQASFKLSDLAYISSQEVGPMWCGCIPARSQISLRFGRYPHLREVPHSLDHASPSMSDRSPFTIACLEGAKYAYGQYEDGTPQAVMNNVLQAEQHPRGYLRSTIDAMFFTGAFLHSLAKQLVHAVIRAFLSYFAPTAGAVGPGQYAGKSDSRSFRVLFKSANASNVAGDVIKTLMQAASAKHRPLVPASGILPLAQGARYSVASADKPEKLNSTHKYGTDGGMVVNERMWCLLPGEKVYDVVPTNPRWTVWEIILTVLTAGYYYCMYVRRRLQYKTSHMVTDRRVVSHTMRILYGHVRHSYLEMWLHAPVQSFTIAKRAPSCLRRWFCRDRNQFEFVTDSTRFGVLRVDVNCEPFIVNLLKVLSAPSPHKHVTGFAPMTRAALEALPEVTERSYTLNFIGEEETIDTAVGSTMPLTCYKKLGCKTAMKFTITFTSNAIMVEAYDGVVRYFTSLSWEIITGTYWSNFQSHSNLFCWHNGPNYITPLHGYSGSQVRLCVRGARNFGIGIVLPNRFYQALQNDAHLDQFVLTLSQKIRLLKGGAASPSQDSNSVKFGAENA